MGQATDTVYTDGPGYAVSVIDGVTNTVTTTIPLSGWFGGRNEIAVDNATDRVYVGISYVGPNYGGPNRHDYGVAVIDGQTNAVATTLPIPGGADPSSIAVDPATDTVYATAYSRDGYGDYIEIISGSDNTVTETIVPHGVPDVVAVNPDSNHR